MTAARDIPLQWMILGTGPASAKTCVTLGLSKLLADRGLRVAPFKAVAVLRRDELTRDHRAPGVLHAAGAARVEPEPVMNPVTVWTAGADDGELVILGEPCGSVELLNRDAVRVDRLSMQQKTRIADAVRGAYADLRARFEAIVIEGAGSPVEAPEEDDWSNQRVLRMSGAPALLVSRFSNGGAAAALVGTLQCLAPELRRQVLGLVLSDAPDRDATRHAASLAASHTGLPILGVIPRLRHGVDSGDVADYPVAYCAWAEALAAHVDLRFLGAPFAGAS